MTRTIRTIGRFLLVVGFLFSLLVQPAHALDYTIIVSATVPSKTPPVTPATSVTMKGIAYPGSTVTIQKNGILATRVPADPLARFDVTLGSLDAGTYTFSVFSTDQVGRTGPVSRFTVTLATGTAVTITGIFLGPTIASDRTQVKVGDTITLFGTTSPKSDVRISVSSQSTSTYQVQASSTGTWVKQFQASALKVGVHSAKSKATDPDGSISAFSQTIFFQVASADKTAGKSKGDVNLDGRVDLIDFSILLYYWNVENPANARADINQDGIVNIIDFSIMLFFWTGTT
jgi:hypothetical protein